MLAIKTGKMPEIIAKPAARGPESAPIGYKKGKMPEIIANPVARKPESTPECYKNRENADIYSETCRLEVGKGVGML